MPLIELSMIIEAILSVPIEGALNEAQHHDVVLKVRRKLTGKLPDPEPKFASVYQHTLIEYGIGKPRALLEFFKYEFVQETFREAFPKREWKVVEREIDAFLETHDAGEELRRLRIDLALEIRRFAAIFFAMVQRPESPAELIRDQTLSEIVERIQQLPTREELSAELTHYASPRPPIRTAATKTFISYARRDGRDFAHALREKLEREGFPIWQDVVSETPGEGWWLNIVEAIEGSAVMILVLTEGALRSQIVRDEWLHARKVGTVIVPVIPYEEYFSALDDEGKALIPRWVDRNHLLSLDENSEDYNHHWNRLLSILRDPPPQKPVPFTVPRLPDEFVRRKDLEKRIQDRLLDDDGLNPRSGREALVGAGGFGKTILAQAACSKPEIVEAFKDGVLWLTLGEEANEATVTQRLNEAIETLGGIGANTSSEASRRLAELLRERDCLIILDDIWQGYLIELFLTDAEDSERPYKGRRAWLLTAREPSEVSRYLTDTAGLIDVGEMETGEAAEMLANYVPDDMHPLSAPQMDALTTLVTDLGEWPLLIHLSGQELRLEIIQGASFENALRWVREGLEEEGFTAFDAREADADPAKWRHKALSANVTLSLRRFSARETQRLLGLSIFSSDTDIPASVVYRLWSKTTESAPLSRRQAQKLLRRFKGPFLRFDLEADTIRFHDVMRRYLANLFGDDARRAAHNALLNAYNRNSQPWHTIDDDGYLYSFLTSHLHEAGRDGELKALFADQKWMRARVERDGYTYTGYLQDLNVAWQQIAHKSALAQSDAGHEPTALAECVRYALIHTSINSLAENFVPELVARAVETKLWSVERAFATARQTPDAEQRSKLYAVLLRTGILTLLQLGQAREQALTTALSISDAKPRASALTALAPQLDGEQRVAALQHALQAALAITDKWTRAKALAKLAPQLDGELFQQALLNIGKALSATTTPQFNGERPVQGLQAALAITDEWSRADVLTALALQLDGEQRMATLQHALRAALAITDEWRRAVALTALAPQLDGEQRMTALQHALQAAVAITDEWRRVEVLTALILRLDGELLQQALQAALAISDEWRRANVLNALAPQLDGELLQQALQAALAITDEWRRVHVLIALSSRRDGEQRVAALQHALQAALAITDEEMLADALTALAPQLDGELLLHALQAALAITDEWSRAKALEKLAPQLDGEQRVTALQHALRAALAITDEWRRADALTALAPQLDGEQRVTALQHALQAALAITDEWRWMEVLTALAPQLDGELLLQALRAALAITDEWRRVKALTALAPQLDGELLLQALQAALAITDEWSRAKALEKLAPQLDGEQRVTALQHALRAALAITDEWRRADALTALAPQLDGEQRVTALQHALRAALAITDERRRVNALTALAPQLDGELLQHALQAALAITDELRRVNILTEFAPQLDGELLLQALQIALAISNEERKARLLALIVPQLDGELLLHALQTALAITDEWSRAKALEKLAPQLDGEQRVTALQHALRAALAITDEWRRADALTALAPQLDGEQRVTALQHALQAALAITDEWRWMEVLTALAPQLDGEQRMTALQHALQAAVAITDERRWMEVLTALAPQLDGELLLQALQATLAITDEWRRVHVLTALAPQLDGEQRVAALQHALQAALAITDEWRRAKALEKLAPQLDGEQRVTALQHALRAALAITDEWRRADALTALAPQLDGEQRVTALQHALQAAVAITDEWRWMEVLTALAPQLDGELLLQALQAALAITDEWRRAKALEKLAPQLDGEQRVAALQHALQAALAITDEWRRAKALEKLAPQLDGEQRVTALQHALRAALAITDEWRWMEVLTALAPQLDGEQLQQLLAAALARSDEEMGVVALTALAPRLDGEQLQQLLAAALVIANEQWRAEALASLLAPCSDDSVLLSNLITHTRHSAVHALRSLRIENRESVLVFCSYEKLFALPFFSRDTLAAIAQHIIEICNEWTWL